jgi:4-amino-4-deoxy-L-arabinose transferase-like glycosyltransferase
LELSACAPLLPLIWFLFIFVFFSISVGKRAVYLLPLYPAAALLIGHYFAFRIPEQSRMQQRLHRIAALLLSTVCAAGAAIVFLAHGKLETQSVLIIIPITALAALATSLLYYAWKKDLDKQALSTAFAGFVLIFGLTLLMPKIEYYRPIPHFAEIIKQTAKPEDEVGTFFVDAPSLMFYAERKIFQIGDFDEMLKRLDGEGQVHFVTRADFLEMLQARTPIPLKVVADRPLLQLRWENFFGRSAQPAQRLVLVKKG